LVPYNFDGEWRGAAKLGVVAVAASHVRDKAARGVALEVAPCQLDLSRGGERLAQCKRVHARTKE
jgi:hypothetical protein